MFDKIKNLFRKRLYLYLVYENNDQNSLITVLERKDQLREFLSRDILVHNYKHFKAWCDLRQLDDDDVESQNAYVNNFISTATEEDLDKYSYVIKKAYYTKAALASILRMFNGCVPVGCSYETEVENIYISALIDKIEEEKGKKKETNNSVTK